MSRRLFFRVPDPRHFTLHQPIRVDGRKGVIAGIKLGGVLVDFSLRGRFTSWLRGLVSRDTPAAPSAPSPSEKPEA